MQLFVAIVEFSIRIAICDSLFRFLQCIGVMSPGEDDAGRGTDAGDATSGQPAEPLPNGDAIASGATEAGPDSGNGTQLVVDEDEPVSFQSSFLLFLKNVSSFNSE